MTCAECQESLQQRLDERRATLVTPSVAEHLADCRICREIYDLSESSWSGSCVSPFYGVPDDFADRILHRAGRQRRRAQVRWLITALFFSLISTLVLGSSLVYFDAARQEVQTVETPSHSSVRAETLQVATLLEQSKQWVDLPKQGVAAAGEMAARAGASGKRLMTPDRWLPPVREDALEVSLRPVRNLGLALASTVIPVRASAAQAYTELRVWLENLESLPPQPH